MTLYFNDFIVGVEVLSSIPTSEAEGKFRLFNSNDSYLSLEFTPRAFRNNDIDVRVDIVGQGVTSIDMSLFVFKGNASDLEMEVQIVSLNYFDANVEIRPFTYGIGQFQLLEPPIITDSSVLSKDSMVRDYEELKRLNFGTESQMLIGSEMYLGFKETYSSFIQFDLSKYTDRKILQTAKLRLFYSGSIPKDTNIHLKELAIGFSEHGLTWYNRPAELISVVSKYIINTEQQYIEFDVLEYIKDVQNGIRLNNGLSVWTDSDKKIAFYTKESSTSTKPVVITTYIDKDINASTGNLTLSADVEVVGKGDVSIGCYLDVVTYYSNVDLSATLKVHRYDTPEPDDMHSYFSVNKPHIDAFVWAMGVGREDIDSTLVVRSMIKDSILESRVVISKPNIDLTTYVKYGNFLDLEAIVRASRNLDIDAILDINNPELNSYFNIYWHEDSDLDVNVFVRGIAKDDINAELTVRTGYTNDISSTLSITKPNVDLTTVIRVGDESKIDANVDIRGLFFSDVDMNIIVSAPILSSEVLIVSSGYFDAELDIPTYDSMNAEAFVLYRNDLNVYVESQPSIWLESLVDIQQKNLDAHMIIPYFGESHMSAEFRPRVPSASFTDLFIVIKGSSNGAYGFIL